MRANVICAGKEVGMLFEPLGGPRGDFRLIEAPRNSQAGLRKRVVIPPQAAHHRDLVCDERPGLQPLPAKRFYSLRQDAREELVTVTATRPKLVIAGDK